VRLKKRKGEGRGEDAAAEWGRKVSKEARGFD